MVIYGVYNTETLEKLVKTVQQMHITMTPNEKIIHRRIKYSLNHNGVHHYAINSLLYLRTLRENI